MSAVFAQPIIHDDVPATITGAGRFFAEIPLPKVAYSALIGGHPGLDARPPRRSNT